MKWMQSVYRAKWVTPLGWGVLALSVVLSVVLQGALYAKLGSRALFFADGEGLLEALARPVCGGLLQWCAEGLATLWHLPFLGGAVFLLLGVAVTAIARFWAKVPRSVACLPFLLVLLQVTYCGFSAWIFKDPSFPQAYLLEWAVTLTCYGAVKRGHWVGFLTVLLYPLFGISVAVGLLGGAFLARRRITFRVASLLFAVGSVWASKAFCYADPSWMKVLSQQGLWLFEGDAALWSSSVVVVLGVLFLSEWLIPYIKAWQAPLRTIAPWALTVFFVGASLWACDPSETLYAILACERNVREGDGRAALTLPEELPAEHRMLAAYYIHSAWRAGKLEDKLFDVVWRVSHQASTIDTMSLDGYWLLYHYGIVQSARRWCYESVVAYGWTPDKLDLMTRVALVCNERALAMRYAKQLARLPFWRTRAERYLAYANGAEIPPEEDLRRVADLHTRLSADAGSPVFEVGKKLEEAVYLRYAFLKNGNRDMVTLYLCSSLLLRETKPFLENYEVILKVWQVRPLPRVFQQALLAAAAQVPPQEQPHLTADLFTPGMVEAYQAFRREAPKADPTSESFRKRFGRSYWYYANFLL